MEHTKTCVGWVFHISLNFFSVINSVRGGMFAMPPFSFGIPIYFEPCFRVNSRFYSKNVNSRHLKTVLGS